MTETIGGFIEKLGPVKGILPETVRTANFNHLKDNVFPTTRAEDWKYTRLTKIAKGDFQIASDLVSIDVSPYKLEGTDTLVFINGIYDASQSSSELTLSKKGALNLTSGQHLFAGINAYLASDGLSLEVAKNTSIDTPIHILQITTGNEVFSNLRHQIVLEDGAKATVLVSYIGVDAQACFQNTVFEGKVGTNANLTIHKLQKAGTTDFITQSEYFEQADGSEITLSVFTKDTLFARNDIHVLVDGQNCTTNLLGGYLPKGKEHVDNHTFVDHAKANCLSNELYKGVMFGASTGVFNGKVLVRKDSQKINAYQQNANILMGDKSTINSKPELEIYADDVKCSHGSVTGQMDEDALFYLRARGINEQQAKELLIEAFIGEVIEEIDNEVWSEYIANEM